MSGDILVRLVNVTKYFRDNKEKRNIVSRIMNDGTKQVEVNNVTIHLYRGEALGIIGIPGSGKSTIGKLISKVIEPSSGKVRNHASTFLATHNHRFAANHPTGQLIETILLTYNIPLTAFAEKKEQIIQFAELQDKDKLPMSELTLSEQSQLLIALTYFLKPEVIIYDDLSQHLSSDFKEKFAMVIDLLLREGKAVVLIEETLDMIAEKANFITWMSYGQVRKSGTPKEVIPLYEQYLKQYQHVIYRKEEALFDLDYKMKRQTIGNVPAMRRVSKHHQVIFDENFRKLLTTSFFLLFACFILTVLIFKGAGYSPKLTTEDETMIVKKKKETFTEKYALAIVKKSQPVMEGTSQLAVLPAGTVVEVTGYNNNDYQVAYNSKRLTMNRRNTLYLNPAALYDAHSFTELEDYMYGNYVNYREFFNGYLGKKHSVINDELYPETKDRYKVKLTKNDIYLQFDDANKLRGFTFPIEKEAALKKKFKIEDDQWIVKVGDGYAVADFNTHQWLYFQL